MSRANFLSFLFQEKITRRLNLLYQSMPPREHVSRWVSILKNLVLQQKCHMSRTPALIGHGCCRLCRRSIRVDCCCVVAKSCLTLCDLMHCSLSGFSVPGIFQTRIQEWVAIPSCAPPGVFLTQGSNHVSCIAVDSLPLSYRGGYRRGIEWCNDEIKYFPFQLVSSILNEQDSHPWGFAFLLFSTFYLQKKAPADWSKMALWAWYTCSTKIPWFSICISSLTP